MKRPTLRDVAREAGMSVTQVSRALNGHDDVAEATRQKVANVAASLRYTPNLEARRLQDPKTGTGVIGLILANETLRFSDPFFGDLLTAITREAGSHGLQLNLWTPPAEHTDIEHVDIEPYDLAIRRKQVDGFIIVRTGTTDPRIDYLLEADFPFVSFGRPANTQGFGAVEIADDCMDPVVEHLADLGHRRIVCLTEGENFAISAARRASFLSAAARLDLDLGPNALIEGGFHEDDGQAAATRLLTRRLAPTAIVAMNDLLALGVLQAAADLEIDVPSQLSVVGFDDIRSARQVQPALTTIRQPAADVGRELIRAIIPALEAKRPVQSEHHITSELVLRNSSGPPHQDHLS